MEERVDRGVITILFNAGVKYVGGGYANRPYIEHFVNRESHKRMGDILIHRRNKRTFAARVNDAARTSNELGGCNLRAL